MTEAEKQQNSLDVLRSLNVAVTTTKLYPPSFPQVGSAVEKAFERTRVFLRNYGELSLSWTGEEPKLCGLVVNQKTLGKTHGKDIFQQLRLLKIPHVVLQQGLTRVTFQQLLVFFTTSPQIVNKEGGGRAFAASLDLRQLFPEKYSVDLPPVREDLFVLRYLYYKKEKAVTDEMISSLLEEFDGETVAGQKKISSLIEVLLRPDSGVDLVLASIASVLKGAYRGGAIFFPPEIRLIFTNVNRIADDKKKQEMATAIATSFMTDLDEFSLHVLLLQNYPTGFGDELYNQILTRLTTEVDGVVRLMRDDEEQVASKLGKDSGQYLQIVKGLERLLETDKGRQFLAREKTRLLIKAGEKERQSKRVQAGITAIIQGDVNSLKNKEILRQLPTTIESLISKGKTRLAATIIENITTELIKGEGATHDLFSESLSYIGDSLVNTGKWDWLEKLSIPLMAWVQAADRADEHFEKIINILQKVLEYYWKNGKNEEADRILKLFFAIRIGKLKKSPEVVAVVGHVQDLSAEKASLPSLLKKSLEQEDDLADRQLIMQGPIVAHFLLNVLFSSEKTDERMKILELLSRMGPLLPPLVLEKIQAPMPWHDKRNLIKLLSNTGDSNCAQEVFEYLNHDDIRVQKEAFSCICKLSGEDLKSNLLKALPLVSGHMREQVVRALIPLADDEVVNDVTSLLDDWLHFPVEIRDSLIVQICALLARHKNTMGKEALERFLQNETKAKAKQLGAAVWHAAKSALRAIRIYNREISKKEIREATQKERAVIDKRTADSVKQKQTRTSFVEEAHIENLLARGSGEKARGMLVDLIYQAAEEKRFVEADKLREWLIEVDPMALTDIIKVAEMLEEQKSASINKDYLQIWASLYDNLTTEEFNALYYSMEHKIYDEEVSLVEQKMSRPELFFINNGQVKLYYNEKNSEVLVKVARQGEILGVDTFFDASMWTINASTLSRSDISSLHLKNTKNWENDFPALESKLHDFCRKHHGLDRDLTTPGKNRREDKRYTLTGRITAAILDKSGKDTGVQVAGELSDVSSGGISFALRISKKKNARVLLGRNVRVQVASSATKLKRVYIEGVLATVRSLYSMNNEYSAHVIFDNPLPKSELRGIIIAGAGRAKEK